MRITFVWTDKGDLAGEACLRKGHPARSVPILASQATWQLRAHVVGKACHNDAPEPGFT